MAIAPSPFGEAPAPVRLWLVPVVSTMAGSALALLPLMAETPFWPSFGLVMALGWRLLRPEMWAAWAALPLGLFDDLVSGAPLGSAASLWTITFLILDIPDARMVYRSFLDEWQIGAAALAFVIAGQWGISLFAGARAPLWTLAPQYMIALNCFPMALRVCARLDRWRLRAGASGPR